MDKVLHLAKIIITNNSLPILGGGLLIEDSKILAVGKKEDFGDLRNTQVIDHGCSLICPGFINLHTHLLYSKLNKLQGKKGLFPWLSGLVDKTSNWTEKDYIASVRFGIEQALSTGTTSIVENTSNLLSITELINSPLRGLIGLEVFGSNEEEAAEIFNKAKEILSSEPFNSKFAFTLSPHAPYDVSILLWKKLINWSTKNKKPLLTHLEESLQEKIWWQEKSGPAIDFWQKINKLKPKLKYWGKYNSSIDFLYKNNLLSENIIATHLSSATEDDLKLLRKNDLKLVHCPRSNFTLNCGTANIKFWDELGFLWGIGTDSSASNDNLDILEELRFAIKQQELENNYLISAKYGFELITSKAAALLSKEDLLGRLKQRAHADFLVYDIKDKPIATYNDPYNLVVWDINNKQDLKEVWINGDKVWIAKVLLHKI